jgi:hypothetical protein
MELRAPIIQIFNKITVDMCCQVINIRVHVEEAARRNGGHIDTRLTEDKSPCNSLSFCKFVSSIVIEIKILLTIKYWIISCATLHINLN